MQWSIGWSPSNASALVVSRRPQNVWNNATFGTRPMGDYFTRSANPLAEIKVDHRSPLMTAPRPLSKSEKDSALEQAVERVIAGLPEKKLVEVPTLKHRSRMWELKTPTLGIWCTDTSEKATGYRHTRELSVMTHKPDMMTGFDQMLFQVITADKNPARVGLYTTPRTDADKDLLLTELQRLAV